MASCSVALARALDAQRVLDAVTPLKDVDAFAPENVGCSRKAAPVSCHVLRMAWLKSLARYEIETQGKHVVVVGRSDIVGKPMAAMLMQRDFGLGPRFANATVSVCHSQVAI